MASLILFSLAMTVVSSTPSKLALFSSHSSHLHLPPKTSSSILSASDLSTLTTTLVGGLSSLHDAASDQTFPSTDLFAKPDVNVMVSIEGLKNDDENLRSYAPFLSSILDTADAEKVFKSVINYDVVKDDEESPSHLAQAMFEGKTPFLCAHSSQSSHSLPNCKSSLPSSATTVKSTLESLGFTPSSSDSTSWVIIKNDESATFSSTADSPFINEIILLSELKSKITSVTENTICKANEDGLVNLITLSLSSLSNYVNTDEVKLRICSSILDGMLNEIITLVNNRECGGNFMVLSGDSFNNHLYGSSRYLSSSSSDNSTTTTRPNAIPKTMHEIELYQITLWLGISLILIVLTVSYLMGCMDTNMDQMLLAKFKANVGEDDFKMD